MAFSPANFEALMLQIANKMLATVEGNSTVNVDFSTPVLLDQPGSFMDFGFGTTSLPSHEGSHHSAIGLEIE